jgi:hypothetical protein
LDDLEVHIGLLAALQGAQFLVYGLLAAFLASETQFGGLHVLDVLEDQLVEGGFVVEVSTLEEQLIGDVPVAFPRWAFLI